MIVFAAVGVMINGMIRARAGGDHEFESGPTIYITFVCSKSKHLLYSWNGNLLFEEFVDLVMSQVLRLYTGLLVCLLAMAFPNSLQEFDFPPTG